MKRHDGPRASRHVQSQAYHLKTNLEGFQFFWKQEVEDFARIFFKPKEGQKPSDQGLLHKAIDPAVTRFGRSRTRSGGRSSARS